MLKTCLCRCKIKLREVTEPRAAMITLQDGDPHRLVNLYRRREVPLAKLEGLR